MSEGPTVKRRHILTAGSALVAGAGVVGVLGAKGKNDSSDNTARSGITSPNISKNRRQFRLATSWPKDFPGLGTMPVRFSKYLYDMTDGRLDVKVFSAGELVGAAECFDACSTGAADMYHAAEYYWQGKAKGFSFFTAVPTGMTPAEIMGWIDYGDGQKLWDAMSARFNVKPFQCGNSGHQTGGWFKREINTLEDFKGLKMRMPGVGGEVIRRLGGSAVKLSGGEIFQSLQSGAIDATEWVGPWNDLAFGFYREAPYYYAPGFHEPGSALSLGINLDIWNSLSASDQAIVKTACKAVNDASLGEFTHENGKALKTLVEDHGIKPRFFSDEILKTVWKLGEEVVAEFGNSDAQTREIYESYLMARNTYRPWTEMSDGLFIKARKAALDL